VKEVTVEAEGFQLYVAPEDWNVGNFISQHHTWESNVTGALKKRLRQGMVFLDIGANIGYFSMLAARAVGSSGLVFSFEASQTNASLIYFSARLNKFDNVHIFPFALASCQGTWMYDKFGSNGMLVPFNVACELMPSRSLVYAMTLDELLSGQKRVDVIKIDIEGAEYMALEGSRELLNRCRPVIYSEFSPVLLQHTSGKSGQEYLELLRSLNYDLCILTQAGEETFVGEDAGRVLEAYEQRQGSHIDNIDIVAVPRRG
jgi:FkbM family methyltransferase